MPRGTGDREPIRVCVRVRPASNTDAAVCCEASEERSTLRIFDGPDDRKG
jgi:hypothetical protein